MPKNVVVCSDGTGNEGGLEADTNVFKLYELLIDDEAGSQASFYDQGLGTEKLPLIGKAFGVGISRNIQDCYEFLVDTCKEGDSIFLFGFSRGAFTVRSLGGMLSRCGLLKRKYRGLTKQAFKLYKRRRSAGSQGQAERFRSRFSREYKIAFIGVWDTVGALGLPIGWMDSLNPFRHRFHNTRLGAGVTHACHALSIDDRRRTFHPTLWSEDESPEGSTIDQIWFSGMHSDVGGGYEPDDLSDASLEWMIGMALPAGLKLRSDHQHFLHPVPTGEMHDSRSGWGWLYRRKTRNLEKLLTRFKCTTRPAPIHQSVVERMNDPDCKYDPRNLPPSHTFVSNPSP